MKFLLLNDNPVVNKLVTLSAQKTGDELVVSEGVEEVEAADYDLLIIDHAVYDESLIDTLRAKIGYKRALFIAQRGEELPEGFDKVIQKPFLPTDLVEFFSEQALIEDDVILPDLGDEVAVEEEELSVGSEVDDLMEDLDLDLDLDLLEGMPELDDAKMERPELEELGDEALLEDLGDLELDEVEDLGGLDGSEGGVLDEDELLEVQGLLDDTVETGAEETLPEGLSSESMEEVNDALADFDDSGELDLELDESDLDGLLLDDDELEELEIAELPVESEEEAMGEVETSLDEISSLAEDEQGSDEIPSFDLDEAMSLADDIEGLDEGSDDMLEDELEMDIGDLDEELTLPEDLEEMVESMTDVEESVDSEPEPDMGELEEEILSIDMEEPEEALPAEEALETLDEVVETSADEEETPETVALDDLDISDDITALDESALELDEDAELDIAEIGTLEDEIESVVSTLSEEELAQDVDEEILLDIINSSEESKPEAVVALSDDFDEFDSLNAHDLKVALGEAQEGEVASDDGLENLLEGEMSVAGSEDGVKALYDLTKTLQEVLKDDSSAAALQGMRINVNITFGDKS